MPVPRGAARKTAPQTRADRDLPSRRKQEVETTHSRAASAPPTSESVQIERERTIQEIDREIARLAEARQHLSSDLSSGKTLASSAFHTRGLRAVKTLTQTLTQGALNRAVAAQTDVAVLFDALIQPEVLKAMLPNDPLAEAKLLGQLRRKELLEAEGGVLGPEQVGDLLGIQRQSVDKRRKAGTLLAIPVGNRFVFPAWQIAENRTLPHLEEVLGALKDHDEWRKLSFFVNGNVRLAGTSPLAALRAGESDAVLRAARSLGEHGGA